MRYSLFFAISMALALGTQASAQNLYQRAIDIHFHEQSTTMELMPDGAILAGSTRPGNNNTILLVRVNTAGNVLWTKTVNAGANTIAVDLVKAQDGNLLLVYNNLGTAPGTATSGWMKLTTDGAVLWGKKSISNSLLLRAEAASDGGFLLCGMNITGGSTRTAMILKLDQNGTIDWSTVFGENGSSVAYDCREDAQGFVYCCGETRESTGPARGFWAKLGPDGDLTGPVMKFGSDQSDGFTNIEPLGNDRSLVTGYTRGFSGSIYSSVFTAVVDDNGELKSSYIYQLDETSLTVQDMEALPGDQFVLSLSTMVGTISPAVLLKINGAGDQLFASQYRGGGESDAFLRVRKNGNGLLLSGVSVFNGDTDIFLASTDLNGNFDDEFCCPAPVNITRQSVTPTVKAFVPTQTAFYAVQPQTPSVQDLQTTSRNLCNSFELDFSLSKDTICRGECVEIINTVTTPGVDYTFEVQGGSIDPDTLTKVCHTDGGVLFVTMTATSAGCVKKLTRQVSLGTRSDDFPNAFTPNGDNSNDVFMPVFGCPALTMNLHVYNRWGNEVYHGTDPAGGWDGNADGQPAPSDVYVWILEYEVERDGVRSTLQERGQVTLIR
jgi:gliding motility-associated-like protein